MDPKTVFTIISLTILANGTALAIAYRGLSKSLRPAARLWQWGTLLLAAGCALFALGHALPRPVMLTLANGAIAFGLTTYCMALRDINGLEPNRWLFAPAVAVALGVLWFSAVVPDFKTRVVIVTLAKLVLACAALHALTQRPAPRLSSSRNLIIGLFVVLALCLVGRAIVYLISDLPRDYIVESGAHGWNLVYSVVLAMLPIVGTTGFLMLCSDVLRVKLEHAAATDFLTDLPNRRAVTMRGCELFDLALKAKKGFAVAVIDVDFFKGLNDDHGHEAGDYALVHVANCLRCEVRPLDMIARSGGEEFTVLFSGMDAAGALAAAERMRLSVANARFRWAGQYVSITVSTGIATISQEDKCFEDILRRADQALYQAKSTGRNCLQAA